MPGDGGGPAPLCCDEGESKGVGRRLQETIPSVRLARVTRRSTFGNETATPRETTRPIASISAGQHVSISAFRSC